MDAEESHANLLCKFREILGRYSNSPFAFTLLGLYGFDFIQCLQHRSPIRVIDTPLESEKADCWKIYSIITDFYHPNPDRLRDWISTPKSNGYESLHTTVMGPDGHWVEVQIRSERMDQIAERGYAAHWLYKEDKPLEAVNQYFKTKPLQIEAYV